MLHSIVWYTWIHVPLVWFFCSFCMYVKRASDFSDYQLQKLMRRSHLNRKLEDVRKTLNASESAMYGFEEAELDVEAERIVSSESGRYILIQGKDLGSSSQEESQEEDDERPGSPNTEIKSSSTSQIPRNSPNDRQVSSNLASEKSAIEPCNPATTIKSLIEFDVACISSSDSEEEATMDYLVPTVAEDTFGRAVSPTIDSQLSSKGDMFSSPIITQDGESKSEELAPASKNEKEVDTEKDAQEGRSVGLTQEHNQQHRISVGEGDSQSLEATSFVEKRTSILFAKDEEKREADIIEQDKGKEEKEEGKRRVTVAEEQVVTVELAKEKEMVARLEKVSQMLELPTKAMDSILTKEMEQLDKEVTQQEKRAAGVTDWMYSDAQVSR